MLPTQLLPIDFIIVFFWVKFVLECPVSCIRNARAFIDWLCAGLSRVNVNPGVATRLVKQQFRKLKDLDSPTRVINALRAGRETLDLIHSCVNGNPSSFQQLAALTAKTTSLTEQIAQRRKVQALAFKPQNPDDRRLKRRAEGRARRRPEALRPHPDAQPIITSRPRPHVPGVRRIPVFVNARGIPYLRIKKPQPPSLSRALRSYLNNRWARIERRQRLEDASMLADSEDQWDTLVAKAAKAEGQRLLEKEEEEEEDYITWKLAVQHALHDCNQLILKHDMETYQRAEDMFNVVLKEKELKRQEKEARRRWWAEYMEGKDRKESVPDSSPKSPSETRSETSRGAQGENSDRSSQTVSSTERKTTEEASRNENSS
ncbi:hypothetical protein KEM54_005986 [Ascosphaera aggregata]|nr:hypothetical protein KEM54_005986 [Ascosphaera aggregata]